MSPAPGVPAKILLIESNVYLVKRLGEALRQEGYEVIHSAQGAYALTMLEWNTPAAILCATNLREMGALEIAPILRADPKTASEKIQEWTGITGRDHFLIVEALTFTIEAGFMCS